MIEAARKWGYRRVISGVFTALVFFLFAYVMYRQWHAGHIHELKYPIAPILLSALGMFGLVVLMGLLWCRMLALMSRKSVPMRPLLHAHFVSWLARYIPWKVGQGVGKVVLGENDGFLV